MTTISEKKLIRFGEDFKKLQKENEKLKEKNKKLNEKYDNLYEECSECEDQIDKLEFNLEKQEQENQENYEREMNLYNDIMDNTSYIKYYKNHDEEKTFKDYITYLEQEIKLKDEIIRLHEST
jgi:septal ring factor EnvC (AmiA/AmiB activator)